MTEEEFWGHTNHPHQPDFLACRPRCHFGWRFAVTAVVAGIASWAVVGIVVWALWHVARELGL